MACTFSRPWAGGSPHRFQFDTGSVGILVPRHRLGPDYQDFDRSQDTEFKYASSGKVYWGQWVKVLVVHGVPATWDGTGDYPVAQVEVFAVDRPAGFDGGISASALLLTDWPMAVQPGIRFSI